MWKALNHGDNVTVGETLRYRSNSNSQPLEGETYLVVRIDQHHFEVIKKEFLAEAPEAARIKAIRYLDVGYTVLLERWSEIQAGTSASQ